MVAMVPRRLTSFPSLAIADGGGLWAGTALLTEAFEHHENHEAERPYDQGQSGFVVLDLLI